MTIPLSTTKQSSIPAI